MDKSILDRLPREIWEMLIQQYVFDEKGRWMLRRHILDGIPYQGIVDETNISYGTVFKKVNDAFEKVKRQAIKLI